MWRASVKDCLKRNELWWFFLHFSFASYNAWFNAALILPSENLEVTLQWKKKERLSFHFHVFFFEELCQLQRLIQCHTHHAFGESRYHGREILGSQQKEAKATTTATATTAAKKQWVYSSKTTNLHVHHAFLYIFSHRCTTATWNLLISRACFTE